MRAREGLADRVLDGSNDPLHCPNASVVLGEDDPNSLVANLTLRVKITFISVIIKSLPALMMLSPELIQMMHGVPLSANVHLNCLVMLWEL